MVERLSLIRARLDALKQGRVLDSGLVSRALSFFVRVEQLAPLKELVALDRDLNRVGIHTAGDAKLLRTLGVQKGKAGELASGLTGRANAAYGEYEGRLRSVEIAQLAQAVPRGAVSELERGFVMLARALKVADIFSLPPDKAQHTPFEIFARSSDAAAPAPKSARVAVAEFWTQRARANAEDVVQKRRDLDSAHELLLRTGAEVDRDRVRQLRVEVSAARERTRALPPTRSLRDLVRHVQATARRDPSGAYQTIRGLYENAVEAENAELANVAQQALLSLVPDRSKLSQSLERSERTRSVNWTFPSAVQFEGGATTAKAQSRQKERAKADELLAQLAWNLNDEQLSAFELASGCARFFDVEDTLAEEVMEFDPGKLRSVQRRVPYPTQTLTYEIATGLHEFQNFVIQDPRSLLYDLAANQQLLRAYLEEEPPPRPKKIRKTAVRVYVCDASGSMHGPRARFRDAIMIAELNNLRVRARRGQPFDPLFFCYFNDEPTSLVRVDNAADATWHIQKLFEHSPAEGQTDITLALVSAFQEIRAARGNDPYLAHATVVLITDGEDRVDKAQIQKERAPVSDVELNLSFISLGEENTDLRSLVLEQRQKGGRAFYHHLSDREIASARTEFDSAFRTLLPRDVEASPAAMEQLLPQLDALLEVARGGEVKTAAPPEQSFDAFFPAPPEAPSPPRANADQVARLVDILDAVTEAAGLALPDSRASEAVVLIQHLLNVYGIALSEYLAVLGQNLPAVKEALERVRLVCRPFA